VTIRLGPGSYAVACASLSHLFTECGLDKEFCENSRYLWKNLSLYNKGAQRTGARERHALGMRTVEGKDPIPLAAYTYLANVLIKSDDPEHVAAHLFLLLEWNLISRADMVINANIDLVGMYNDSLCFQVGPSKGDQEGSKHQDHPFHVYSVPQNPAICPVLAFCKHLLCNPRILSGKCKLFDGANQYERFNNILRGIVTSDEHRQALIDLQMPPNYFGTHSLRKGAVTHVACGTTSSPPIVSICIRANWAMPGVMSRYIRYEAAGDMYVGRSVCGRHRLEKEFAESIPYFDFSEFSGEDKEEKRREVDAWIRERMPEEGRNNDVVFCLFKTCIASLVYHRQFLDGVLHPENAIRCSVFWSEKIPYEDHVVTRFPWNRTSDTPEISGLPIDVLYMSKIETLLEQISELKEALIMDNARLEKSIVDKVEHSLDMRSVGGEGYGLSKQIDSKLDELIRRVTEPIQVAAPTKDASHSTAEIFDHCDAFDVEEEEDVLITIQEEEVMHSDMLQKAIRTRTEEQMKRRKIDNGIIVGFHHGVLNPLPSSWRYPKKMNVIQMITLYQIGCKAEGVPALKLLNSKQVNHFDKEGMTLSRMRRFMKVVKHFATVRGVWQPPNSIHFWNGATVTKLWDGVWDDLAPFLSTVTRKPNSPPSYHKSRTGALSWRTCHDKMKEKGLFALLNV
jgi:hypothetical protein